MIRDPHLLAASLHRGYPVLMLVDKDGDVLHLLAQKFGSLDFFVLHVFTQFAQVLEQMGVLIICAGAFVYAELLEQRHFRAFAIRRWDCAMAFWRRWRQNTIAARDRAGRWNRNAGSQSSAPSNITASICIMRCRCATRHCFYFLR